MVKNSLLYKGGSKIEQQKNQTNASVDHEKLRQKQIY